MTCSDRTAMLRSDRPLADRRGFPPFGERRQGPFVRSAVRRASDAVAVVSPIRRDVPVTGHRRAVPLLPEQAHASPFRLSHPPLVPSEYNRRRLYDSTKNPSGRSLFHSTAAGVGFARARTKVLRSSFFCQRHDRHTLEGSDGF